MTSKPVTFLLADLGVAKSHNRPYTSNDNPYSEAQFKTLTETPWAWLLRRGRRDDIATVLFIHPQTVRYRMGQLRELYGDRLNDPEGVLAATVALGPKASGRS